MRLREYIDLVPRSERCRLRKKIAKEVGVSETTVRSWANGNRKPAASIVSEIVSAKSIDGQVKAHELRPDVFKDEAIA